MSGGLLLGAAGPVFQTIASIASLLVVMFLSLRIWQAKDATIEAQKAQIEMLKDHGYDGMSALIAGMKAVQQEELTLARNRHDPERIRKLEADKQELEALAGMMVRIIADARDQNSVDNAERHESPDDWRDDWRVEEELERRRERE